MTIFRSTVPLSCEIPSNLTVPQFLFDEYPHCPVQAPSIPCLIDDDTGRLVFMEEVLQPYLTIERKLVAPCRFSSGRDGLQPHCTTHTEFVSRALHRLSSR